MVDVDGRKRWPRPFPLSVVFALHLESLHRNRPVTKETIIHVVLKQKKLTRDNLWEQRFSGEYGFVVGWGREKGEWTG